LDRRTRIVPALEVSESSCAKKVRDRKPSLFNTFEIFDHRAFFSPPFLLSNSPVVESTRCQLVTGCEDLINLVVLGGKCLAGDAGETRVYRRNGPDKPDGCPAGATRSRQGVRNATAQTCEQLPGTLVRVNLDVQLDVLIDCNRYETHPSAPLTRVPLPVR